MSLMLLVIVVVAGIAAVVAAVHLTGGSRRATLADEAAARRRFGEDFPDLGVRAVHLTRERNAAILVLEDGRIGIVQAVGGKFLTRKIAGADLAGAPRASSSAVSVRLRDFTWPGGVFAFAGQEEAKAVEALFAALHAAGAREKAG